MRSIEMLRKFIIDNFLFGDGDHLQDNTQLFETGIVDSTGILEIISFIEETYGIKIEDEELIPENFSSLTAIDDYLACKLNPATD